MKMTDHFSRLLDILERNSNCSSPINVCIAFKVKVKVKVKWGESSMRGRGSIKTNKEVNKTRNPFFLLPSFYQSCLVSPSIIYTSFPLLLFLGNFGFDELKPSCQALTLIDHGLLVFSSILDL